MKRRINIEHPDLTKMRDDQLVTEAAYTIIHARNIIDVIQDGMASVYDKQDGVPTEAPTWKYVDDLKLAVQRHEAIIEECLYRAEMMR